MTTESETTLALRTIQPSSDWHRWSRGETEGHQPASKRIRGRRKKSLVLGVDYTDPANPEPVVGSYTKSNRAQKLFLKRQERTYNKKKLLARKLAKKS
jgi:hypothetical protein